MRWLIPLGLIISIPAQSQLNRSDHWEVSGLIGPALPSSISGVSDTLMLNGARLGVGLSYYRPEVLYIQGTEEGVTLNSVILSVKNPLYIDGLDDIRPFFLTGLQITQYEAVINSSTQPEERGNGFHLGFGVEIEVSRNIDLRNDYYFMNGPGRVLFVGLGVQFQFGGEDSQGAGN